MHFIRDNVVVMAALETQMKVFFWSEMKEQGYDKETEIN